MTAQPSSRSLLAAALVASLTACAAAQTPAEPEPASGFGRGPDAPAAAAPASGASFGGFVTAIPEGYQSLQGADASVPSLLLRSERATIFLYAGDSIESTDLEHACRGAIEGFATGMLSKLTGREIQLDVKRFDVLPARPGFAGGCQSEAAMTQARSQELRAISSRLLGRTQDAVMLCILDVTDALAVAECQAVLAGIRPATP